MLIVSEQDPYWAVSKHPPPLIGTTYDFLLSVNVLVYRVKMRAKRQLLRPYPRGNFLPEDRRLFGQQKIL